MSGLSAEDQLYNAAVAAQLAAAMLLAKARYPGAREAWVNDDGFFAAFVDDVVVQVGTATEATPFAALTRNALEAAAKERAK